MDETTRLAVSMLLLGVVLTAAAAVLVAGLYRMRGYRGAGAEDELPRGVRDVLRAMDDPAVVVGSGGRVAAASRSARSYGLRVRRPVGVDGLVLAVDAARAQTAAEPVTVTLVRGVEPRTVAVRARALGQGFVLVVLRDVTAAERVEHMRRDFVANTSHELKTPVGAVALLAEAVEAAADEPEQVRRFAARLQAEASRLSSLTADLLALSRAQADALDLHGERPVGAIVGAAVAATRVPAEDAGVDVRVAGDLETLVRADERALTEAVANLLSNAVAFSPHPGVVDVRVTATRHRVRIAVTDRGIGIDPADHARVFERFYRTDQARSRRTGGTGLGLAIVRQTVRRHGGDVAVRSVPGEGSTFTITLPRSGGHDRHRTEDAR